MRKLGLIIWACLSPSFLSGAVTWDQVKQTPEFVSAKKQIAEYLPDLAIPKIVRLLEQPDLDKVAKASLLTLLGEAQVRSNQPGSALKTLDDLSLREFSPAHLWRSYALTRLGRYSDAISELAKIDRRTMLPDADLQAGKLHLALGNLDQAQAKLEPLLENSSTEIVKEATLQLISLSLSQKRVDNAAKLLESFKPATPAEESLVRFLNGRLQLAQGERLSAVGTFQTLLNDPEIKKNLPAALFHESTVALADSLALDGNEETAVTAILDTLEKYPDSPKLDIFFSRFREWSPRIDTTPLIQKLRTWIPVTSPPSQFPIVPVTGSVSSISTTTVPPETSPRSLLALEFLATTNLRSDNPELQIKGRLQLSQLLLISPPNSFLVSRLLLELGMLNMGKKDFIQALAIFSMLEETKATSLTRTYAKALAGRAAFAIDDPAKASQSYLEAEEIAREIRETNIASLAALNAGITLLTTSRSKELDEITRNLSSPESRSFLILERGLFLSSRQDLAARDLLTSFLTNFPDNPRTPEATLALAESAVFTPPFDQALAETHITPLRFDAAADPILEARRILVLLALNKGIQPAHDFLVQSPTNPLADRILFQLGQTYRNPKDDGDKEMGKANLQFELLLEKYPESQFADLARYYSALTSVALKTESADKNALKRFRELIDKKGILANEAAINLCSFLIDRNQQQEALNEIPSFLKNAKLPAANRQRFLILGADAANQIGQSETALGFYDELLKLKDLPVASYNKASYIRGQALEKLGRTVEALETYDKVVNRDFNPENTTTLEWKWFDKCGIEGALALLEKEERWKAVIKLAEKIGASGSPRAKDAREIAERIGLEHFIYRERTAPGK